jgi:hypothetical protein
MNKAVSDFLANLNFGEVQQINNLAMLPIIYEDNKRLNYIVLDKALEDNLIEIKEVSQGGSVPELFVVNKSFKRIFIVDGEELKGAKQNRIANTSILLRKNSETKIPVSCVERGRWNYVSDKFTTSKNTAAREIRMKKSISVSASLRSSGKFASDQGQVWEEVDKLMFDYDATSPTSAMNEVYNKNDKIFEETISNFKPEKNHRGFIFFQNGEILGFDYFSKKSAFYLLFSKVIKGYISSRYTIEESSNHFDYIAKARQFFDDFAHAKEESFKSIGLGNDFRYENNHLIASALVVDRFDEKVIHFSGHNKRISK